MQQNRYCNLPTFLAVAALQFVLVTLFCSLASLWSPPHGLLFQCNDPDLLQMLPDIFSRYYAAAILGGIVLVVFFSLIYTETASTAKRWWVTVALSLFFYILLMTRLLQYPISADDAMQNYRWIYNWINGISFDYNPGLHSLGFTSNINMAMLALTCFIFDHRNIPVVSQLLCTAWQCATFLLLFLFLKDVLKNQALAVVGTVLYDTNALISIDASTGKESSLLVFLMVLSLYLLYKGYYRGFVWTSALLALTRPEGIIWLALAVIWSRKRQAAFGYRTWIFPVCVVAVCYLLLWFNFGTLIPGGMLSRLAERQDVYMGIRRTVCYIFSWLGEYTFQGIVSNALTPIVGLYLAYALQGLLAFCLLIYLLQQNRWLEFYGFAVIWLVGSFSIVDPRCFNWYYAWFTILPIFIVLILIGYECALLRQSKNLMARLFIIFIMTFQIVRSMTIVPYDIRKSGSPLPLPIAAAMYHQPIYMPVGLEPALKLQLNTLCSRIFSWSVEDQRMLLYKRAVDFVRSAMPSKNRVIGTAQEPGMIGFCGREFRILDLSGVQSEEVLKYYPVSVNGRLMGARFYTSPQAIHDFKPDCLIALDCYLHGGLLKNEYFLRHYRLLNFWPLRIWRPDTRGLYVFEKAG